MKKLENQNGEQLSIFDYISDEGAINKEKQLSVVETSFIQEHAMNWEELFDGYNDLKVITYSSGLHFIGKVLQKFDTCEIVFGNEHILSNSLQEILSFQSKLIEKIAKFDSKKNHYFVDRIEKQTLHFYVVHEKISHQKIYLLKSYDGKKRVIYGSANMSYNAFNNVQHENISYMDGDPGYDYYLKVFETIKLNSVDDISKQCILSYSIEDLENLPIAEHVKKDKVLLLNACSPESEEEIQFVLDVNQLNHEISKSIPKPKEENGLIKLVSNQIQEINKTFVENREETKKTRQILPNLVFDFFIPSAYLNDSVLELQPNVENVNKDIELYIEYMNGFERFHGDWKTTQEKYYMLLNWLFVSPFIAQFRDAAIQHIRKIIYYPSFGVIFGSSKAGKTKYVELIEKMMIGDTPTLSSSDFTSKKVNELRYSMKGFPVVIDDIKQARFTSHAIELIKDDKFGFYTKNKEYPCVLFTGLVFIQKIKNTLVCCLQEIKI